MSFMIRRTGGKRAMRVLPVMLALGLVALPRGARAQESGSFVSGDAFGALVETPLLDLGPTPQVTLPAAGGSVSDSLLNIGIPDLVSSGTLTVSSSGSRNGASASSQSSATVENLAVSGLLGSILSASVITASTSCTLGGGAATCSAAGSTFATLVVNGNAIPGNPAPNTVIGIPGVATVRLNEQISSGDGVTNQSLTVNMVRVTILGGLGPPLAEITIGHSHSDVGRGGLCTGSGAACESAADCGEGEGCCGDATVDASVEACDAGAENGVAGSGCTASCEVGVGLCTGSGAECASAADCPEGEGCCGDGTVTAPAEECESGDACTASCQIGSGECTGSGEACESAAECPAGEGCCGNGVVEAPAEECDGSASCKASCEIGSGLCTGSGGACDTAAECPAGEGCCGNSVIDPSEECDDGNTSSEDSCSATCSDGGGLPLIGCEGVPVANIVPAFIRGSFFRDSNHASAGYERWKSRGDFNLPANTSIDPDSQAVRIVFSQGTVKYDKTLPVGSYVQSGSSRPKWRYSNPQANIAGAEGWKKSLFRQKLLNKFRNVNDGINVSVPIDVTPNPLKIRHTVRVNDLCITGVMTCTRPRPTGVHLRCRTLPN